VKRRKIDLVEVIKANPGCVAIIDNDCWSLHKVDPGEMADDSPRKRTTRRTSWPAIPTTWSPSLGDGGYGSGNCYGGDILQALAKIVGIKVQSV